MLVHARVLTFIIRRKRVLDVPDILVDITDQMKVVSIILTCTSFIKPYQRFSHCICSDLLKFNRLAFTYTSLQIISMVLRKQKLTLHIFSMN